MAPNKSLVLLAAILLLAAAAGQVRCGGLLPPVPDAAPANTIALITGRVPCSIGSNISLPSVLPFPNATVQVVCAGDTVASVATASTGTFAISLGPISNLANEVVTPLLNGQCSVVVATPLVACNASLAGVTGTLSAPLQLLGGGTNTTGGILANILGRLVLIVNGVLNLTTGLFSFVQIING